MPDLWVNVDAAVIVPVNILPLLDDTDFKSIETAVVYNSAGLALTWNFQTSAGVVSETAVTPTTGGDYDWSEPLADKGMYAIEIPAASGASINNDTEGVGWFTGVATGVLPWRGPTIGFRRAALNNLLMNGSTASTNLEDFFDGTGYAGGTTKLDVSLVQILGAAITGTASQLVAAFTKWFNVATPTGTVNSIPDAVAGAANGLLIAGTNAPVTITGSGNALTLTSTGANGSGLLATGNGTGNGLKLNSGAGNAAAVLATGSGTGAGLSLVSGAGNANGIESTGSGTGDGLHLQGGAGGGGDGLHAQGGAGALSRGIHGVGGTTGAGIRADAAGNQPGIDIAGSGSGAGVQFTGGATGPGLLLIGGGTSGAGLSVTTTSGDGISVTPTAGNALTLTANGTSKHGLVATGGTAGTSDGIKGAAGSGGVDIRGNITGNITGALSGSVASVTGNVVGSVGSVAGNVTGSVGSVAGNVTGSVGSIASGGIAAASFAAGAIDAAAIANDAIDASAIANGAIDAATFAAGAIDAAAIANGAIDSATFATGAITADALAADAGTEIGTAVWASTDRQLTAFDEDVTTIDINATTVGAVAGAVGSVTGNVGGNVSGTIGGMTVAALKDFFDTDSGTTYGASVAGSVVKEITDNASGSGATAAQVWGYNDRQLTALDEDVTTLDLNGTTIGTVTNLTNAPTIASVATVGTVTNPVTVGTNSDKTGYTLTGADHNLIADATLDRANAIETGLTLRQALRLVGAAVAGKLSGAATATITIRNPVADDTDRIVATVDADGNRTAITYDVS